MNSEHQKIKKGSTEIGLRGKQHPGYLRFSEHRSGSGSLTSWVSSVQRTAKKARPVPAKFSLADKAIKTNGFPKLGNLPTQTQKVSDRSTFLSTKRIRKGSRSIENEEDEEIASYAAAPCSTDPR